MLIDEIKKANIEAMKARDVDARSAYSIVMSRYTELKTNGSGKEVGDQEVVSIILKFEKELLEEGEGYKKAGREAQYSSILRQIEALKPFKPQMMSEEEIRNIISSLEDKSMPSIMKYFKANYNGKCDMSLVNKIARAI
ncbi:MAG: GatB/YqeY domain-containing protein [Bacilli bacterium]|nr:GatB/YqeY domain-containing protein [Bacilli bacterium]